MIDALRQHLLALVGDRHPVSSPEGLQRAERYLTDTFRSLNLTVTHHSFEGMGGTYRNVIATQSPSTLSAPDPSMSPLPPLVVAAHYDTVAHSPGADDNASGLAVMLETARLLRTISLRSPIRFIAFCLEEEDLLGSRAYAAQLRKDGDVLHGAIVLECVGYASTRSGSQAAPPGLPMAVPTTGDFLGIIGNEISAGLVHAVAGAAKQTVPDLPTLCLVVPGEGEAFPDTRRSDHAAFWAQGYSAIMLTDTANFRNPHYHRSTDVLATLDLGFMGKVTRLFAAAVETLAATE